MCLVAMAATAAMAAPQVQFPRLQKDRVYLLMSGLQVSAYEGLEKQIVELEKGTHQSYYAVIIGSAGDGQYATRDYADGLFRIWSREPGFDADRSVLVVAALGETPPKVAIHPGKALQALGLRPSVIQRELIEQPATLELARRKKFPDALASVIRSTQSWIAEAETARNRSATAEREFTAQVKKDAAGALATADRSLDETTRVLEEKRAAGLGVNGIEARVNNARAQLSAIRGKADQNPREVLSQATEIQHVLEQELARLRGLPELQNQALRQVETVSTQLGQFEDRLEEARKAGLSIGPLQAELKKMSASRDEARKAVARDPEDVLAQANAIEAQVKSAEASLAALPALHADRLTRAGQVEALRARLTSELEKGRKAGASLTSVRKRFEHYAPEITSATAVQVDDEAAALGSLAQIETQLNTDIQEAKAARERHVFLSRTLPIGLGAGLLALVGMVLGGFWLVRNRKQSQVDQKYKSFRARATEVMESLDRLKERHRLLPSMDADFTEPPRGDTLNLYITAQDRLKQLWDRWLQSMDNLERAQKLITHSSGLGTEQLQRAEDLLKDEKPFEEIKAQMSEVTSILDQLGNAHEEARAAEKSIEEGQSVLAQRIGGLETQGLPATAYQADRATVTTLLEHARKELVADPIAAQALLRQAKERLDLLRQRAEDVARRSEQARGIVKKLDDTRGLIAKRRGEGLKLDEPGGNPDEPLAQARQFHSEGLEALKTADPSAAAPALDNAEARVELANRTISQVDAAREAVGKELPERQADEVSLRNELKAGAREEQELRQSFDPASWSMVATSLGQAGKLLETADPLLAKAKDLASDGTQRYLECQSVLTEIGRIQQQAGGLRKALHDRLEALQAIQTECQGIWPDLVKQGETVAQFVDQHSDVVGNAAKAALTEALQLQHAVEQRSSRPQPNWVEIQADLAKVREGLAIANDRAQADVKAQAEVQRKLAQLLPRMKQVGDLLRSEDKDRPPANIRYKAAVDSLSRIQRDLDAGPNDWQLLLKQLDDVVLELNRSEELARQDLALANQAASDIDEAKRTVRTAQGYSALGVSADVRLARAQLEQAERAVQSQDYEHAIELAANADRAARQAYNEANRQAAYRQQQIEADRRRRAAETMARRTGRLPTPGGLPPSMWEIGMGSAMGNILGNILSGSGGAITGGGGGFSGGFGGGGDAGGGGGQGSWGGGGGDGGGQGSW